MFAWGPSLQVPLLVRFPKRWQHLAPTAPGGTTDRLVSFVDFAPTVLSLAGVSIPAHMQGAAFLGERAAPPRTLIFGGKDRQGECADTIRYVRDALPVQLQLPTAPALRPIHELSVAAREYTGLVGLAAGR